MLNRVEGRTRFDLLRWGAELLDQWGVGHEYGFHLIEWAHDDACPLASDHARAWSVCRCQPDATLIVDLGLVDERQIDVVRAGRALPVRPCGSPTA